MKKKFILAPIIVALLVFIDLLSKTLIFKYVGEDKIIEVIKNFFYINPVYNTGASFGMLKGWGWFFIITTIIVLGLMTWYFIKSKSKSLMFITTYSFITAGALGNLVDRIITVITKTGGVRDFIYIKFFPAVFNFADICITVGVILFIIWCILDIMIKKKSENNGKI